MDHYILLVTDDEHTLRRPMLERTFTKKFRSGDEMHLSELLFCTEFVDERPHEFLQPPGKPKVFTLSYEWDLDERTHRHFRFFIDQSGTSKWVEAYFMFQMARGS